MVASDRCLPLIVAIGIAASAIFHGTFSECHVGGVVSLVGYWLLTELLQVLRKR